MVRFNTCWSVKPGRFLWLWCKKKMWISEDSHGVVLCDTGMRLGSAIGWEGHQVLQFVLLRVLQNMYTFRFH